MSEKKQLSPRVLEGRPVHVHTDPTSGQTWECDSAYCNTMTRLHPDNGGKEPRRDD